MPEAQMKVMRKEFEAVIADAKLMAFIQVVRRQDKANVGDVLRFAEEIGIDPSKLTVGQVFLEGTPRTGKEWAKGRKALGPSGSSDIDTRTEVGRIEFDARILNILRKKGDWTAAEAVRSISGGTAHQVRCSMKRLHESGDIRYKGKLRATRYRAK